MRRSFLPALVVLVGMALPARAEPPVLRWDAPMDGALARTRLVEVNGRAGAPGGVFDLVLVLDLSESTLHESGADLDGDGPDATTDPALLAALTDHPDADRRWKPIIDRLRRQDFDDTILAAQLEAAEALIERLDLVHFRVGIVVFSDGAEEIAPLGAPKQALDRALAELRTGFPRHLRGTNFQAAIDTARRMLVPRDAASPAMSPADAGGPETLRRRSVVFLSDGAPSIPVMDRPSLWAEIAARKAAEDEVVLFPFAFGPAGGEAMAVMETMARLTGGRAQHIEHAPETAIQLRELSLVQVERIEIENLSSERPTRALRVFPDGSFDAFVWLEPGLNRLRVIARFDDGRSLHDEREVSLAEGKADEVELRRLVDELRRRSQELELWVEIEERRRRERRDVEIEAEKRER